MPRLRHGLSTAIRPMWPSGSRRAVPTASPSWTASAWRLLGSNSSISISRGTPCSSTKTASRIALARGSACFQLISSICSIAQKYNRPMKSLWSDAEAAQFTGALGARVYTSRLLGRDKSLVLHGGGNTSVKLRENDVFGEARDVLYVKGSGSDLATIEPAGFAPVALAAMQKLARLSALTDRQMVNELSIHRLRADAPSPSVETLLHALLPHAYVDHTHADAVLSISNSPDGEKQIREIYGDRVVIVPYVMAGFQLAVRCAQAYPRQANAK